jgi:hypothetical protein
MCSYGPDFVALQVSPCILACSVTRELALNAAAMPPGAPVRADPYLLDKLEQCHAAVIRGAAKISDALEIPKPSGK